MPCLTFKKNCNNSRHIKQQLATEKGGMEHDELDLKHHKSKG